MLILLTMGAAVAVGLWLSSICALYRDVRHTLPFLLQILLFASPIIYPSSLVPEAWRPFYGLNPLAGIVEGFRWSLLGGSEFPSTLLASSATVVFTLFITGLAYFRRVERQFVDVV